MIPCETILHGRRWSMQWLSLTLTFFVIPKQTSGHYPGPNQCIMKQWISTLASSMHERRLNDSMLRFVILSHSWLMITLTFTVRSHQLYSRILHSHMSGHNNGSIILIFTWPLHDGSSWRVSWKDFQEICSLVLEKATTPIWTTVFHFLSGWAYFGLPQDNVKIYAIGTELLVDDDDEPLPHELDVNTDLVIQLMEHINTTASLDDIST